MNEYICYGIIDLDTKEFLKTSYKLFVPFYRTKEQAKNGLKGFKAHYRTNKNGYKIVKIIVNNQNTEIVEENL